MSLVKKGGYSIQKWRIDNYNESHEEQIILLKRVKYE